MDSVATPDELKVAAPSCVEPFRKLTVPVGVVEPEPFTVAVSVSVWPVLIEFAEATKAVVVDCVAAFTVTETEVDELASDAAFPAYCAVRLYVPAAKVEVDSVAAPEELTVADPSCVEPLMKLTVPVGVVEPEPFTVAVKVRD